ncbi:Crp/Fnr family transcriptional regulator [Sporanaerobium hydrogeniformans]|uniref:Crp/Fnr family transcriptional regulator n=1 Tax=Sporanaerobium hydrogeniformans TaxID=3072179 RepID=A0AC61DDN7_9FIRM|nr:Crp/Fnr family transcriptional regulator [Sporanaerobium hydrogeniformans]PHV70806.1 Crp/Fnr family transcriptional regulator [Sporanaerobium hydrogeniformans]
MNQYLCLLKKVPLFMNIKEEELESLLYCLGAQEKGYINEETLFSLGEQVDRIGIVLEGQVEVVKENILGDRHIIALLSPGQLFGEGIVCTDKRISPVTVRARSHSRVLFIPYEKIVTKCPSSCTYHTSLIKNMLKILGEKNFTLNQKIDYLVLKGLRQRLALYLLDEARKQGQMAFNIVLNRNELADYLNVCRSAMCRELSRMKQEGLIDYYKNGFKILDANRLSQQI